MNFLTKILFLALIAYVQAENCKCRLKTENRIVNGQVSTEHSIPWLISLADDNYHICGGSIINKKLILTAAHCIDGKKSESLTVRVGLHNVQTEIPKDRIYQVAKIISHEYHGINAPGDIAILELEKEIEFIEGEVEKACFNTVHKRYTDQLLAAGWGRTQHSYINPKTNKMSYRGKAENLKHAFFKQDVMSCQSYLICLNPVVEGDSICQGDSGGPLHYTENGITSVQGVASFVNSDQKGDTTIYCTGKSAYSRLSTYSRWFRETVQNDYCTWRNAGQ